MANVPKEVLFVAHTNPDIVFNEKSMWVHDNGVAMYYDMKTCLSPYGDGALTNFLYKDYGNLSPRGGLFTASINGSILQRLSNKSNMPLDQRMF